MNLACAGSAFGSLHGRGTSVSRVQSSCFFCEDLADQANAGKVTRPGNDRGFAARPGLAFTCNHHRFRGAHTHFVSKQGHSERLNVQLIPDGFATTGLVLKTSGWWRPRGRGTRGRAAQTGSIRQEFTTNRARKKAPRGPGRGGRQRRLPRARGLEPERCRAPFRPRRRMRWAADRAHAARPRRGGVCGATEPRADDRPSIGHSGA